MSEYNGSSEHFDARCARTGEFTCSAQSILSAMDAFIRAVHRMNDTILVPSRLRDMQLREDLQIGLTGSGGVAPVTGSRRSKYTADYAAFYTQNANGLAAGRAVPPPPGLCPRRIERPAPLMNCDLYAFYTMLEELRKELLWGPATGQSTIYTNSFLQGNPAIMSGGCTPNGASRSSSSQTGSLNNLYCQSWRQSNCTLNSPKGYGLRRSESSGGGSSGVSSLASSSGFGSASPSIATGNNSPAVPNGGCPLQLSNGKLTKLMDCDLDSELDSMLTDRTECGAEQSLHLASAFKHHLQGLHTILQQLTNSTDYLTRSYQLEVDED